MGRYPAGQDSVGKRSQKRFETTTSWLHIPPPALYDERPTSNFDVFKKSGSKWCVRRDSLSNDGGSVFRTGHFELFFSLHLRAVQLNLLCSHHLTQTKNHLQVARRILPSRISVFVQ